MNRPLRFGFSPCPNDTFAFWAAVHAQVPGAGLRFEAVLADVERLNARAIAAADPLEVTKLSVPALCAAGARYELLPAGAALGFGCGPLVVARQGGPRSLADLQGRRVAIPGGHTTAFLLFGLFGERDCDFAAMPFDQVMPAVARGECDAGLVIHEGRFTFREHGLEALADLGELWERDTGLPLPLGVIAARADLGPELHEEIAAVLRASVQQALAEPALPRAFVRRHAQEMDDAVCQRHIALYVNEFSVDLGRTGRAALQVLIDRGRERGLLPANADPLRSAR